MTTFWKPVAKLLFAAGVIAATFGLSGCGGASAAPAEVKPTTVVLVHGAWADGSNWSKVIPLLQQRGLKVVAVQLQRNALKSDADIVERAIAQQTGQVVLVGHSYGGAVITQAGGGDKVKALVYVAAFAPGQGESIADLTAGGPPPPWQPVQDSAGYLTLDDATFTNYFAPDLPRAEIAVLAASQGPIYFHALQDKVAAAAWKTKPSWWALSGGDAFIPPAFQQAQAARIGARVTPIPGASHVVMLSHPNEVGAVILSAVGEVGCR